MDDRVPQQPAAPRCAEAGDRSTDEPTSSRTDVGSGAVLRFAREVWASHDPMERLRRGVALATELVGGCDHAAVTVLTRGSAAAGPATDAVGRRADELQHDLDEGPCLEALRTGSCVTSEDLAHEPRWPRWAAAVVEQTGVRATMSLVLRDDDRGYGSLDLYSDRPGAWSPAEVVLAQVLAAQLTLALADALQIEHRGRAMVSRTVIGQAQGVLMERFGITAERAYAVLKRISQQDHVKLLAVAEELVRTSRLPGGTGQAGTPPDPAG